MASDMASAKTLVLEKCPNVPLTDCLLPGGSIAGLVAMAGLVGAAVAIMSGDAGLLEPYWRRGYRCLLKPFGSILLLRTLEASIEDAREDARLPDRKNSDPGRGHKTTP